MASQKRIDINTASLEDLESLVGVGHAKAEHILEHRKRLGGFSTVNELVDIPGIGPSILELNRGQIQCGGRTASVRTPRTPRDSRELRRSARSEGHLDTPSTSSTPATRSRSSGSHPRLPRHIDTDSVKSSHQKSTAIQDKQQAPSDDTSDHEDDIKPSIEADLADCMECSDTEGGEGRLATLRSRNHSANHANSATDKQHMMKRKCDAGSSNKDMSPGKKPCRLSEETPHSTHPTHSPDTPESPGCGSGLLGGGGGGCPHCPHCGSSSTSSSSHGPPHPVSLLRRKRIPSKANPPPELAFWLKTFQEWSHAERLLALDEMIEACEVTEVRHMMAVIEPQFQRDFISLLPKELALYVLSYLEPRDLCRAAQTCRYWRILASDNLLWREKCREETITEAAVFENQVRKRQCGSASSNSSKSPWKGLYLRQKEIEHNWRSQPIRSPKVLKGHDDHVITCLEFCGTRIVSGSDDNTLKVWSAVTGKCLRTLLGHTGGVWSSQMSNNIIISGSTDRTLKVWNAETGQCIHTLYGHTSTVRCMCLHQNKVVSGSRDATLRVWDVDSGQCLHVLMGHVAAVRCVQYDGKRVVSGAYDYMVKIWDPDTETCLHTLQGHTNRVYSLQFDGTHIVSGSLDTSIRVWDVESGQCLHTLIGHQSLTSGMELKDSILVSGNADSTVKVWDIKTGHCLQTLQGPNKHQSAVTCLQFNKKFVITSSDDGTVKIWSLRTGDFLRNLVSLESGGSGGVVWRIRTSNTKLVCAVGSRNGTEETKLLVLDFDVSDGNADSSEGTGMVRRSSVTGAS